MKILVIDKLKNLYDIGIKELNCFYNNLELDQLLDDPMNFMVTKTYETDKVNITAKENQYLLIPLGKFDDVRLSDIRMVDKDRLCYVTLSKKEFKKYFCHED